MPAPWTSLPVLSIDCESTGVNPFEARIVELAAVEVRPDLSTANEWRTTVVPGVEIPDEAAAIHGITTERAQAEGVTPRGALGQLVDRVWNHLYEHRGNAALVIFNAPYDLSLLITEAGRHGIIWPTWTGILDPLVLDRMADVYRRDETVHFKPVAHTHAGGFEQARQHRNGNRKLIRVADLYGVDLGDAAHGALADATAAGRVLWAMLDRFPKLGRNSLASLWLKQVQGSERERDKLQDWIRQNRDPLAEISGGWPLPTRAEKTPKAVERAAGGAA